LNWTKYLKTIIIFVYLKLDLYRRINALKTRNPKLKTLLAVGGWNMKSYAFSAMVHNSVKRRSFIFDSIK
jgi:GH18 family chitinase